MRDSLISDVSFAILSIKDPDELKEYLDNIPEADKMTMEEAMEWADSVMKVMANAGIKADGVIDFMSIQAGDILG